MKWYDNDVNIYIITLYSLHVPLSVLSEDICRFVWDIIFSKLYYQWVIIKYQITDITASQKI